MKNIPKFPCSKVDRRFSNRTSNFLGKNEWRCASIWSHIYMVLFLTCQTSGQPSGWHIKIQKCPFVSIYILLVNLKSTHVFLSFFFNSTLAIDEWTLLTQYIMDCSTIFYLWFVYVKHKEHAMWSYIKMCIIFLISLSFLQC